MNILFYQRLHTMFIGSYSLSDWKLEHIRRVDVNQVRPVTLLNTIAHKMYTAN